MGWYGPMAHALRWQLPGSTAGAVSAAERGRLAGELVRRWPPMACILLGDLRSSLRHAPPSADVSAGTAAHQPDSPAREAGSRPGSDPSSADPNPTASAREQPTGIWAYTSALLQALHGSFHCVTSRHDTLRRVILQALGEFCTCLLRREKDFMPQPPAAGTADEVRAAAESALRTALTVMQEMLADWGDSAAVGADSAPCYKEAMEGLLDALNAGLAQDLAAMTAGGSSTPAFQEQCHLKARLLLCGVSAQSRAEPADDDGQATPARERRVGGMPAHSVFTDATATAALWAALQREWVLMHSLPRVPFWLAKLIHRVVVDCAHSSSYMQQPGMRMSSTHQK